MALLSFFSYTGQEEQLQEEQLLKMSLKGSKLSFVLSHKSISLSGQGFFKMFSIPWKLYHNYFQL